MNPKKKNLIKKIYGLTNTGKVRNQNEDYYFIDPERQLFIVADGMGGHKAGEIASAMTVKIIVGEFNNSIINFERSDIEAFFRSVVIKANREVIMKAAENPDFAGMGTTVAMALLNGNTLYTCHVGDSRIYIINKDEIRQVGNDHSVVQAAVMEGKMTREEAWGSNMKNLLTSAIGGHEDIMSEFNEVSLKSGDRVLLCSDGLWDMLPDREIHAVAMKSATVEKVCKKLMEAALEAGGTDNITIICVQ